jgi:hypothetical protein
LLSRLWRRHANYRVAFSPLFQLDEKRSPHCPSRLDFAYRLQKEQRTPPTTLAPVQVGCLLTAASEVPAVTTASTATGVMFGVYAPNSKAPTHTLSFSGLTGNAAAGHLPFGDARHSGPGTVSFSNVTTATKGLLTGTTTLTQTQADSLLAGRICTNIYLAANPGGEIRANLAAK